MRKICKYFVGFIAILVILVNISSCNFSHNIPAYNPKNKLLVHYIDVGQGDSILIQSDNTNILIDAGPKNSSVVSYLKHNNIKKLDYVIATHPHDDHIGSMSKIINNFKINNFYAPKVTSTSTSFKDMVQSLNNKKLKITTIKSNMKINFNNNTYCFIIAPNSTHYDKLNNYSVVLKLIYGNTSFLFTGDAETLSENEILKNGFNLKSDILKVGHHGSNSSTSKDFLNEVSPKVAIISCGKDNDYGHPNKKTLINLKNKKIMLYRTDLNGTIVLQSDGNKIIRR